MMSATRLLRRGALALYAARALLMAPAARLDDVPRVNSARGNTVPEPQSEPELTTVGRRGQDPPGAFPVPLVT